MPTHRHQFHNRYLATIENEELFEVFFQACKLRWKKESAITN
ncbi:hypothetical protein B4087_0961 [Bacillus cereus]|nr:hypothetical protein B4087_0961 [Bacillus cereus]